MLTCLFVRYLVSLGYPLASLWFPLETVLGTEMFLFGPRLILGGAYMLVSRHARSSVGVRNLRTRIGERLRMIECLNFVLPLGCPSYALGRTLSAWI